jgi:glycosyltransferase involved in cell wall biosynthesis
MTALSIIIPTYNRSALVAQAIRTIQSSGVPGVEIVVADDGSTDDTEAAVRACPGVVYVRQRNAGPAAARNNGFGVSTGRYVTFLDSDDEWIAGGPARLLAQLDRHPDLPLLFGDTEMGDVSTGFVSFVDTYGGAAFDALPHAPRRGGIRVFERAPFFRLLSTRNVMFLGSLFIRREAFEASGGFDPALRGAADWELFMRLAASGAVAFSGGPAVSRYFKRGGAMSDDSDHMERDFILALDAIRRRCALDSGSRVHLERELRRHLFGWAYEAYDRGNYAAARTRFAWTRELGHGRPRDLMYVAATRCPRPLVELARRVWRGEAR